MPYSVQFRETVMRVLALAVAWDPCSTGQSESQARIALTSRLVSSFGAVMTVNSMGADTDPMLFEQALPPLLPGSEPVRDSAYCDDLPPSGAAGDGVPGFLGKVLLDDISLFAGSQGGRSRDLDGPALLLLPSSGSEEVAQTSSWNPG